jgi:hypothetical protein
MCTDHFLEDVVCLGGPHKGPGVLDVDGGVVLDSTSLRFAPRLRQILPTLFVRTILLIIQHMRREQQSTPLAPGQSACRSAIETAGKVSICLQRPFAGERFSFAKLLKTGLSAPTISTRLD